MVLLVSLLLILSRRLIKGPPGKTDHIHNRDGTRLFGRTYPLGVGKLATRLGRRNFGLSRPPGKNNTKHNKRM